MKQQIIVCGYPKSGNTWLTRLTGELVQCPVMGFWCEPFNRDAVTEGLDRLSDFQCFKAHHALRDLRKTFPAYAQGEPKLVYIYRDPRDVIVSGSHFFVLPQAFPRTIRLLSRFPPFEWLYHRTFQSVSRKARLLTDCMIEGGNVGHWMQVSWDRHLRAYRDETDCLMVSYERLQAESEAEASRLCDYLGIKRTPEAIAEAIHRQSFETRKRQFRKDGNRAQEKFLRSGQSGTWRDQLSPRNIRKLEAVFGPLLKELGYPLSTDG